MPKALVWDEIGNRTYETGVDHGAIYFLNDEKKYDNGVAWSGLSSVAEKPSGAEATAIYADNIKYLNMYSNEDFAATIEAYTYPDEFAVCDGSVSLTAGVIAGQQARKAFGLSYRTRIGNDVDGDAYGYKLHLVYGCRVSPSEKNYSTVNDSPEAITFSWELSTTPVNVKIGDTEYRPTSLITIDSTKFTTEQAKAKLAAFEKILWGSTEADARMPLPDEVVTLLGAESLG